MQGNAKLFTFHFRGWTESHIWPWWPRTTAMWVRRVNVEQVLSPSIYGPLKQLKKRRLLHMQQGYTGHQMAFPRTTSSSVLFSSIETSLYPPQVNTVFWNINGSIVFSRMVLLVQRQPFPLVVWGRRKLLTMSLWPPSLPDSLSRSFPDRKSGLRCQAVSWRACGDDSGGGPHHELHSTGGVQRWGDHRVVLPRQAGEQKLPGRQLSRIGSPIFAKDIRQRSHSCFLWPDQQFSGHQIPSGCTVSRHRSSQRPDHPKCFYYGLWTVHMQCHKPGLHADQNTAGHSSRYAMFAAFFFCITVSFLTGIKYWESHRQMFWSLYSPQQFNDFV